MSACTNNPATGRLSCGGTFGGELQHCVARVPWSQHPDGRAHVTGSLSVIDTMWRKGDGEAPANPVDLGFEPDSNGRWRSPADETIRELWATA
jgi:hypothetical protein